MTELDKLLQRLNDKDSKGREEALYALGELGDMRAVEPLIDVLEDPSIRVRKGAAVALGWLKDKRAVDPLLKYLKTAQASEFSSITYALSELQDKKAVEPMIQLALESESQQIRKPCIRALGKMDDKRAIIPLIEIITNEKEAVDFQTFTKEILDRMLDDEGINMLIKAFDYPYEAVKWFASRKLRDLSDKSFELLVHAIKEGSGDIRKYSIITVAEIENSKNIDFLNQFINDNQLKYYAAVALSRGDTQVVNILIEGLKHPSTWVREHSALALGRTKDKKGFGVLIAALKDPRREVRAAAATALGELRDENAIEPLIQAVANETGEDYYTKGALVREAIAEALGKIGGASERLLELAKNENIRWTIRFFFIVALVEMGNKQGIDLAIEGMNHSLWYMRYNCSKILKRFVEEKKIPLEKIRKPISYFFDPQLFR